MIRRILRPSAFGLLHLWSLLLPLLTHAQDTLHITSRKYVAANYCTCGDGNPHRRSGINYFAAGGGFGVNVHRGLELDIAFMVYQPLLPSTGPDHAYSYTQYVIGLNYEFRLKRR